MDYESQRIQVRTLTVVLTLPKKTVPPAVVKHPVGGVTLIFLNKRHTITLLINDNSCLQKKALIYGIHMSFFNRNTFFLFFLL